MKLPKVLLLTSILTISACQAPPTKISERDSNRSGRLWKEVKTDEKIDFRFAVIVDTRSRFDYEMSRLPRSFHALPQDWNLAGLQGSDLNQKVEELQRLLSLKGIDPLTQVVLVGLGPKGKGEEYFIASTFKRLGVERLQILPVENLKKALTTRALPELSNVARWQRPLGPERFCSETGRDYPIASQVCNNTESIQ